MYCIFIIIYKIMIKISYFSQFAEYSTDSVRTVQQNSIYSILIHYAFPYSFHMLLFIISVILTDIFCFKILYMEKTIDSQILNWPRYLHGS